MNRSKVSVRSGNMVAIVALAAMMIAGSSVAADNSATHPPEKRAKFLLLDGRIIDEVSSAELAVDKVKKHPGNPLFGEDKPWEPRFDNMYPSVLFDTAADRQHVELAWSPDSVQWHRIRPGTPLIPNSGQEGAYDWGCIFAAQPVFLEDEIRLYYGGCNNNFFDWRDTSLCLASVRPDRFAGYEPKEAGKAGIVVTRPVICSGKQLRLNANATAGSIRVEVVGQPGLTLQDCRPITGDILDGPATWDSGKDLSATKGKSIMLRFEINGAKLFAFRFAD